MTAKPPARRVRVAEGVYQRIDAKTGRRVSDKFEYTYRDATGRQIWQTSRSATKVGAKAERSETLAPIALVEWSQVCRYAVRRGWLAVDPVSRLEAGEKPRWDPRETAILERPDLAKLLEHAGTYRSLFEFLAYTGLRIGEALGVRWCDID